MGVLYRRLKHVKHGGQVYESKPARYFKGDKMATKKTETKQTKTKKAVETKKVKKPAETKKAETKQLEITYIYHEGDDIAQISKQITGKSYMEFKLLSKNGKDLNTLKDGDILKWEL